jgi:hypothetical protein
MKTKIADLKLTPQFSLFGNKGACWSNSIHIAESNLSGKTLCGVPMLSSNHYRLGETTNDGIKPDTLCDKCASEYKNQNQ